MDQIVNNAAKLRHMSGGQLRCPIVFRGPTGIGGRLSSQHSQSLEANYAHFPGLKVIAPGTPADGGACCGTTGLKPTQHLVIMGLIVTFDSPTGR